MCVLAGHAATACGLFASWTIFGSVPALINHFLPLNFGSSDTSKMVQLISLFLSEQERERDRETERQTETETERLINFYSKENIGHWYFIYFLRFDFDAGYFSRAGYAEKKKGKEKKRKGKVYSWLCLFVKCLFACSFFLHSIKNENALRKLTQPAYIGIIITALQASVLLITRTFTA